MVIEKELFTTTFPVLECASATQDERAKIAEDAINEKVAELNAMLTFFYQTYCTMPNVISHAGKNKDDPNGKWLDIETWTPIRCSWNGSCPEFI